jgi:thiamine-phosphate pyrophosphorylase
VLSHLESPPPVGPRASVPRLTVLVDAADDLALLPDLAAAGVDGFQVRAKAVTDAELLCLARLVVGAVRPHGALVTVCDRVDVALAAGADGVHVGAEDLPIADVRRLVDAVRPGMLVGATCRDRDAVARAAGDGASYAGFGPVCASGSKTGLPDPLGVAAVGEAAGVLPLVAIGGIDAGTAREVRAAGADGVAVIGALWRHPDPVAAAEAFVTAVA